VINRGLAFAALMDLHPIYFIGVAEGIFTGFRGNQAL
jgi:hypothetical protein